MRHTPFSLEAKRTSDTRNTWDQWLVLAGGLILLAPKINLIQIDGQTSGIRIDDLFLMFVTPYLLIRIRDALEPILAIRLYLTFIGFAFLSALWNVENNGWKLMLYPLRLLEYTSFLVIGALCKNRQILITITSSVILINTSAALGQMFLGWGGFPHSHYSQEVGARAIGLTAGPWEMAAIVNIALAYLAFAWGKGTEKVFKFILIYMVALVCVILSGSRVGLVVNTLIVASYLMTLEVKYWEKLVGFAAILVISTLIFIALPNSLGERSRSILEKGNLENTQQIGQQDKCLNLKAGATIDFAVVDNGKQDPSWGVRAQKWANAVCLYHQKAGNYLLGVGPGFFGPALDGSFVRVLVEHGAFGLAFLLASLAGLDIAFRRHRLFAIVFAAHMVFIDIYLSYKFVSLLLFILGALHVSYNDGKTKAHDLVY